MSRHVTSFDVLFCIRTVFEKTGTVRSELHVKHVLYEIYGHMDKKINSPETFGVFLGLKIHRDMFSGFQHET